MSKTSAKSGTFTDNMKLPLHRWYRYSAGFSAEWVEQEIKKFQNEIQDEMILLEPFAGSGTTNLVADSLGFKSYGFEGHPFVAEIAQAKQHWFLSTAVIRSLAMNVLNEARSSSIQYSFYNPEDLLGKCYTQENFNKLMSLRFSFEKLKDLDPSWLIIKLLISSILRACSHVGTAQWQYILPNKSKSKTLDPFVAFEAKLEQIINDMEYAQTQSWRPLSNIEFHDFRQAKQLNEKANLVITSPPYPNNYDYADATRLEMMFWGEIKGWSDLKTVVRPTLMRSCSQHSASDKVVLEELIESPYLSCIRDEIYIITKELSDIRLTKGGKKTYHTMIAAYFYDLAKIFENLRNNLSSGSKMIFVIGDSAPYGVYVPADEWLGKIAISQGFTNYSFNKLRDRNIKWDNRTHKVLLKEGLLTIQG
ncbi:hypothetical protein MKK07_002196 [Acinetobacter baumannii]|nr:DNA modification methylase [Acinetobacter baumannii]